MHSQSTSDPSVVHIYKQTSVMAVPSPALGIISSAFTAATGLNIHHLLPVDNEGESAPSSLLGMEKRGLFASTTQTRTPQAMDGKSHAATAQTKPDVIMLSAKDLFGLTYMMIQPPSETVMEDDMAAVSVHMLKTNVRATVQVRSNATVKELREDAAKKMGLRPVQLMLIFNNSLLADHQEIKYLGIASGCTIIAMSPRPPSSGGGGGDGGDGAIIFKLDPASLAPRFDYDLTGKADDGAIYHRGDFTYYRPYGWKRYALNVLGDADYESDKWLGGDGIRKESTDGEWPVSYHGTKFVSNVRGIVGDGYKKGPRHNHGYGVYSSPSVNVVVEHRYAETFTHESTGKTYKFVLQNRVNPDPEHLTIHRSDGMYWLSPKHDPAEKIFDIRPYGILTREV